MQRNVYARDKGVVESADTVSSEKEDAAEVLEGPKKDFSIELAITEIQTFDAPIAYQIQDCFARGSQKYAARDTRLLHPSRQQLPSALPVWKKRLKFFSTSLAFMPISPQVSGRSGRRIKVCDTFFAS